MKTLKDIAAQQQASRPAHDDPLTDRLVAEIVSLAEEVCVLRDRLDTAERLETGAADAIDAYEPDETLIAERLADHTRFYEEVFARISVNR